jgi:uncharacterized protein with HEPN domain
MRTEALYLDDMVEAAEAIERFLNRVEKETFLSDDLYQSAVLQKLIVIGEAAAHLSPALRERHRDIDWPDIIGLRNVAVHNYFGVSVGAVVAIQQNAAVQDVSRRSDGADGGLG